MNSRRDCAAKLRKFHYLFVCFSDGVSNKWLKFLLATRCCVSSPRKRIFSSEQENEEKTRKVVYVPFFKWALRRDTGGGVGEAILWSLWWGSTLWHFHLSAFRLSSETESCIIQPPRPYPHSTVEQSNSAKTFRPHKKRKSLRRRILSHLQLCPLHERHSWVDIGNDSQKKLWTVTLQHEWLLRRIGF